MTLSPYHAFNIAQIPSALPVIILATISTVATIILILILVYLLQFTNMFRNTAELHMQKLSNPIDLFLILKDWKPDEYRTLLSSFLLHDEYIVLEMLISSLKADGNQTTINNGEIELNGEGGWRNRNHIVTKTELSNRRIYGKSGIIERLVELQLIEERDNPKPWGRQTKEYRANVQHPLVRSMAHALE